MIQFHISHHSLFQHSIFIWQATNNNIIVRKFVMLPKCIIILSIYSCSNSHHLSSHPNNAHNDCSIPLLIQFTSIIRSLLSPRRLDGGTRKEIPCNLGGRDGYVRISPNTRLPTKTFTRIQRSNIRTAFTHPVERLFSYIG